jgi:hypothetical protein
MHQTHCNREEKNNINTHEQTKKRIVYGTGTRTVKSRNGERMSQTTNNEEMFTRRDDQVGLVAGCFIAQRVLLAFDGRG